jgi:hypothetical protein
VAAGVGVVALAVAGILVARHRRVAQPDFQADYLLLRDRDFSQLESELPRFPSLYDELERAHELRLLKRR